MNQKIFVCSDIHGFYTPLKTALKAKGFDEKNPDHILMVLGDYEDRGQEAVKLFKFLLKLQKKGRLMAISGNHEDLILRLVSEIMREGKTYNSAHYSNGTIGTLAQFANDPEITRKFNQWEMLSETERQKVYDSIKPYLDFIHTTVNYYEIGKYIFTHGWIPFSSKDQNMYHSRKKVESFKDWRKLPDWSPMWDSARWLGYPTAVECSYFEPGKIIVCGHWHSSEWNAIQDNSEPYPTKKNGVDWQHVFRPAITDKFIAIDACTAYSGIVNVLVFEKVSENELILLDN